MIQKILLESMKFLQPTSTLEDLFANKYLSDSVRNVYEISISIDDFFRTSKKTRASFLLQNFFYTNQKYLRTKIKTLPL